MKVTKFQFIVAVALFALAFTPNARAQNTQSFKGTNYITATNNYSNFPTNAAGLDTGAGIQVDNYNNLGFYFTALVTNDTSSVVGFHLVRAARQPRGITNWETSAIYKIAVTIPAQTNTFSYVTNLPADFSGAAVLVGLKAVTNNLPSSQTATAADYGVTKKIIPVRYP